MKSNNIDDLLWQTFVKSGGAGYYMLYKALEESDKDSEKQSRHQ